MRKARNQSTMKEIKDIYDRAIHSDQESTFIQEQVPAMKEYRIFPLAIALCILCIAVPLTVSAATISLSKTSSSMYTGATDEFILTIDELPQGFTGYKLTGTISNPAVAEISAVAFPGWASLSNTTAIPSSSVRISGVDMSDISRSMTMQEALWRQQ